MQINNGKLVSKDCNDWDISQQRNETLIKQYQDLELKIATITQPQESMYVEETNTIKVSLQKFDTRLIGLENTVSNYLKQFLLTNICGIIGMSILWFWTGDAHHFNDCKNPPKKPAVSVQLHHHLSR